jgi:hypothetical protein
MCYQWRTLSIGWKNNCIRSREHRSYGHHRKGLVGLRGLSANNLVLVLMLVLVRMLLLMMMLLLVLMLLRSRTDQQ